MIRLHCFIQSYPNLLLNPNRFSFIELNVTVRRCRVKEEKKPILL